MRRQRAVLLACALVSAFVAGHAGQAASASKAPPASVPLLALPAAPVRTSFGFSYRGVLVSVGFAYDPLARAGVLSFEPQDGSAPARVYIQGIFWNGAKFDLMGRRFAITVSRRLPLLNTTFSLWEDGARRPLLRLSGRQAKGEMMRLAQSVVVEGRRYAVLQGPRAARVADRAVIDRNQRFIVILRLLDTGKTTLAASVPWDESRPRPPSVLLKTSADGKQLILAADRR